MKSKFISAAFLMVLFYSCNAPKPAVFTAPTVVPETPIAKVVEPVVVPQEENPVAMVILTETQEQGKKLYENNCAKCHKLFDPKSNNAEKWVKILHKMQPKAQINDADREKIYSYLTLQ